MIKGHRKLNVQDLSNRGNDISLEVNWNKQVEDCKYIKVKIGDKEGLIKRDHLYEVLMLMATPKQQESMVGNYMNYQSNRNYRTVVNIMAKNNIQKGQEFGVPLTVSINEQTGGITIKP